MTDLTDLAAWLRQQLDDEERLARETGGAWIPLGPNPDDPRPIARLMSRYSPARVLAEVDAKRRILDDLTARRLDPTEPDGGWEAADAETDGMASSVVRLLALPYADRPGYHEEWRP